MAPGGAVDQNLDLDLDPRPEFAKSRLSAVKREGGDAEKVSLEASHVYSRRGPRDPEGASDWGGVRLEKSVFLQLVRTHSTRQSVIRSE